MDQKYELRKLLLAQRSLIMPFQKQQWDLSITAQLKVLLNNHKPKVVHSYISMQNEVNVLPIINWLLDAGIKVVCPKSLPKRTLENRELTSLNLLESGMYGTQHPALPRVYSGSYDLILVPGLAFDKQGFRMGYGAGYYDTFLAQHPESYKVGVCYPFQLVDEVPTEPHDAQLNEILIA